MNCIWKSVDSNRRGVNERQQQSSSHCLNTTMLPDLVFSPEIEQWRPWLWNDECISARGARCFQAIINTVDMIMWGNVKGRDGYRSGLGSFRGGHQGAFEEVRYKLRSEWSKKPGTWSPIHPSTHKVNFPYIHSALLPLHFLCHTLIFLCFLWSLFSHFAVNHSSLSRPLSIFL